MPAEEQRAYVHGVTIGTGHGIFQSTILPAIERAESEVILITCFWAPSPTQSALKQTLLNLSQTSLQRNRRVKVRIGFSSSSLSQKLCPPSRKTHHPSGWKSKLGLPAEEELKGLDLQVKSVFFLPFSVWHSKFVIVDRKRVFLPSCNVSWEDWFEGCVEMRGRGIVGKFVGFWRGNWEEENEQGEGGDEIPPADSDGIRLQPIACEFLPSRHSRNPRFQFLPWKTHTPAPSTPLNSKLVEFFETAREEIYIQTPNITSPPVLDALTRALKRGISVTIITNENLMVLEQLVTAGTTTARCVRALVGNHERLREKRQTDEEAGIIRPGRLRISYYVPLVVSESAAGGGAEPVQSHLKLTIVDDRAIVFGSGNMDRASWYTSQELGVAFFSEGLIAETRKTLEEKLKGRTKVVYDSG